MLFKSWQAVYLSQIYDSALELPALGLVRYEEQTVQLSPSRLWTAAEEIASGPENIDEIGPDGC